jgi:hypothetical protein
MEKLYKTKGLRLKVKTYIDLEGVTAASIKYRKPDGSAGSFDAGVSDPHGGILIHECIETDLDQAGWWVFWASVVLADGRVASGAPEKIFVWDEGK